MATAKLGEYYVDADGQGWRTMVVPVADETVDPRVPVEVLPVESLEFTPPGESVAADAPIKARVKKSK